MSSDQPYAPGEAVVRLAYADRRLFEDQIGGYEPSPDAVYNAEFDRFLARVRRDAAREALEGLADHESRLVSESNLFQDKANHLFASQAAGRYRYDHYPEETP